METFRLGVSRSSNIFSESVGVIVVASIVHDDSMRYDEFGCSNISGQDCKYVPFGKCSPFYRHTGTGHVINHSINMSQKGSKTLKTCKHRNESKNIE